MGLFDLFRKKPARETKAPEKEAPRAEIARDSEAPRGPSVVPPGHKVAVFRTIPPPQVVRAAGGAIVAHLGMGCDEPAEVIDRIFDEVEAALGNAPSKVLIGAIKGPIRDLFAPDPPVIERDGLVLWVVHDGSLNDFTGDPARLQSLIRRIYRIGSWRGRKILQCVYRGPGRRPGVGMEIEILQGLGLEVRSPEKDGAILAEVHRPGGIIISALVGPLHPMPEDPDPYPRTVNEEKDRAEAEGDRARLDRVETMERTFLAKRIASIDAGREAVMPEWSPYLRRLLLEVATKGGDAAWGALKDHLSRRAIPVALMEQGGRGVAPRQWPGQDPAIVAYPDIMSLQWATDDMRIPPASYVAIGMRAKDLFDWARNIGVGVAINVYRDRQSPLHVMFGVEKVKSFAPQRARR